MPQIKKTKGQKGNIGTHYSISVTIESDPNKTVSTVEVFIPEVIGQPNAEPQTYTLNYILEANGKRLFRNDAVVFNANAVGYEYSMTFTMYDMYGNTIGTPVTAPIAIEEAMMMA